MGESRHVLVGSGDADLGLPLRAAISGAGHRVTLVSSGKEAVSRAAGIAPDVVVLDNDLPGLTAAEVAANLHTLHSTRNLPVLFLLEGAFHPGKMKAFRLGVDQVLQKPFDLARLTSAFQTLKVELKTSAADQSSFAPYDISGSAPRCSAGRERGTSEQDTPWIFRGWCRKPPGERDHL